MRRKWKTAHESGAACSRAKPKYSSARSSSQGDSTAGVAASPLGRGNRRSRRSRRLARLRASASAVPALGGSRTTWRSRRRLRAAAAAARLKMAGSSSAPSALITPSAPVAANAASSSPAPRTLPLVSTGMASADLTAATCAKSAGPLLRCIGLPRKRPCTARRAQPARSSACAKATVSASPSSRRRILQNTGTESPCASVDTIPSTRSRPAASAHRKAP
mmetsp:Transcript_3489/g.11018  ORF Transcript_3489/g.11018 Transcript_3489/m.11018 type:complete len:220 (-) Transcript_3489:433-1092(-)